MTSRVDQAAVAAESGDESASGHESDDESDEDKVDGEKKTKKVKIRLYMQCILPVIVRANAQ